MDRNLITKYDVAAPRYTSYPTVPYWGLSVPTQDSWRNAVLSNWRSKQQPLSLYIHLLFCESLCTYCACNTRITTNHKVELPYIARLLKEWSMYTELLGERPTIGEIHLGGGTPTFFSPENLQTLMDGIRANSILLPDAALSFEAHPGNTTREHLEVLYKSGFHRLSLGVQDFNPKVQRLINRMQTEEQVREVMEYARQLGYSSINFDLIYGLPAQTLASITDTTEKVIALRPERIAFYSYAHVPWMRPGQRAYTEADLPAGENKRALYERGRALLEQAGYVEIGLDHFALPGDELLRVAENKTIHRNFMGYTERESTLLVALGASSISDAGTQFVQNAKTLEEWNSLVDQNQFPFFRGHELLAEDLVLRKHIMNIMCREETDWTENLANFPVFEDIRERLEELEADGIIQLFPTSLRVTEQGKPFLRNVGLCFDARFHLNKPKKPVFSQTA